MMDFIIMTLSIALGFVLSIGVTCVLMAQPWMMKLYYKYIVKVMENMNKAFEDEV